MSQKGESVGNMKKKKAPDTLQDAEAFILFGSPP